MSNDNEGRLAVEHWPTTVAATVSAIVPGKQLLTASLFCHQSLNKLLSSPKYGKGQSNFCRLIKIFHRVDFLSTVNCLRCL